MKKIAIIGSSGGNLYNLGGALPEKLLAEIYSQCDGIPIQIAAVQFIAADASMDGINPDTQAAVYVLGETQDAKPQALFHGTLSAVNQHARQQDTKLAQQINAGTIDGLIVMSGDPHGVNREAIAAAVAQQIPIVGTGGTSMALIAATGAKVIATSGTTGTTSRTRAISFIASLARFWDIAYRPILGTAAQGSSEASAKSLLKRMNIRSIMIPALPGFIAMAIVLALSHVPGMGSLNSVFEIMLKGLPVLMAVLAAKQVSELDEVSIVSGIIAGVLSVDGGLIGGIIGGIMAGILVRYLFELCLRFRFPMTTVNIVAGGVSGLAAGLVMFYLLSPLALLVGDYIKFLLAAALAYNPVLAGLLAGLVIWPAILTGVYHAVILPLVLLEMEKSGVSFLGAVDMVGLVMVAAGINLANVIAPRDKSEVAVATPGLMINLGFGTFVESAYPFMFANKIVFFSAIAYAGLGGMMLGYFNVMGVAYVPAFLSPFVSNNALYMAITMVTVMVLTCVTTVIANRFKAVVNNTERQPTAS